MSITPVDKVKIMKYLRENPIGEIYYLDLCDAIGKRNKVKDIEFLDFFVDAVIKEFKKDEKISIKQVSKLVVTCESFLEWIHEAGSEIDDILLDKIRSFEEYYDEYLNRTNYDIDLEFTDGYLASILKKVNELYPKVEVSESVVQYLNEIEILKEKLFVLKREYDNVVQLYESLQKKYDKKHEDFIKKSDECSRVTQTSINRGNEIDKLNQEILFLSTRISDLESLLIKRNGEISDLVPFKENYNSLLDELNKLKSEIEKRDKANNEAVLQRLTDSTIEGLIYRKLLCEGANINEILGYLKDNGYSLKNSQVYDLLKRIKSKINLVNGTFSLSPTYKIVSPNILESGLFDIGIIPGTKKYDILLVSDFHLREINDKVLSSINNMYDYCVGQDIKLILNLGDYFDHLSVGNDFENAVANYRLAESTISLLPKVDGIYQAVLGGNHDKRILKYGFDPIEMVSREREDIINLGYTHSTITLNGSKNVLNSFDLHHPGGMSFDLTLSDNGIDSEGVLSYLDGLYEGIGRSRDDSFVDLFGHTHKSQFNFMDSYCFIPSLMEGRARKGACHLRIYLDEETQIKYMVFMPLSINEKYIKQTEIVYYKNLTR